MTSRQIAAAIVALWASMTMAQSSFAAEPQFIGEFAARLQDRTIPLEREEPHQQTHVGFRYSSFDEIPGPRSAVRFSQNDNVAFIVRVASVDVDPHSEIVFQVPQVVKGERRLSGETIGGFTVHVSSSVTHVPFEAERYHDQLLLLKPSGRLEPGEYCLSLAKENQLGAVEPVAYCFGVD
jgi:hypothetical protein